MVRDRSTRYPVIQETGGPSLTKQAEREECDVNVIMKKYERTGVLESFNRNPARYGDVSSVSDYRTALEVVRQAEEAFASLPAEVRDACGNVPIGLVELVFDPEREDEARALGLLLPGETPPSSVPGAAPAGGASTPAGAPSSPSTGSGESS